MSSRYNPHERTDNCGFCAIAYARAAKGIEPFYDADELYEETIKRLGIKREGKRDPLPRLLIFPEKDLDAIPVRTEYQALPEHGHTLSDYTVTSVAEASGLSCTAKMEDLTLVQQFLHWCSNRGHDLEIGDFVDWRLNFLHERRLNPPRAAVESHIAKALAGDSIIGSKLRQHYINLRIQMGRTGRIEATDPQNGATYDGRGLALRLTRVDLLVHVEKPKEEK
jgi:hypothetical protein